SLISLVIPVTREIRDGLLFWDEKAREYVDTYYQGNEESAKGTRFYRGFIKTRTIINSLIEIEQEKVRSVFDNQNLLASLALIQDTSIFVEEELVDCIEIESLTNSPFNTIDFPVPEKRKGAATSLVEGIIRESREEGLPNILKLIPVPNAIEFYQRIGFEETDISGDMILEYNAASMFLLDLEQKRNSASFD
ncbi:MAG: GNAT family N-acetyltransferase, partial [Cyanobacteria bacterium J06636_27]